MQSIRNLLSEVQVVVKKNREILDRAEWNFNVFRLCGTGHYENSHSRILAEFLNPRGMHGLGAEFLRQFLSQLQIDFVITPLCEVVTELSMGEGRMDIVIRDTDWVVVIENKIYALEQEAQLSRYWKWAVQMYGVERSRILYLTLEGKGSETARGIPCECMKCISYAGNVLNWLSACVNIAAERPFVRETLRQYRNHIRTLTGQSMEENTMKELIKILTEPQNFEAFTQIRNCWENARDEIAKDIIREAVKRLDGMCEIDETSWNFYEDDNGVRIKILNTGTVLWLCSECGKKSAYSDMYVGVASADLDTKLFTAVRNVMTTRTKERDSGWDGTDWWIWKYLPPEYFDWSDGDVLLKCLKDEKFKEGLMASIVERIKEIVDVVRHVQ